jgi:hypothetical protein
MTDELNDPFDPLENPLAKPDVSVTAELFRHWRAPRYGRANPERMNNPVWEWLIRSELGAYSANKEFGGPSSCEAGPCWCFSRFGQSSTELPDHRVVLIAGEHEDFYDPDFVIYNDVVVKNPDGTLDIYGYPKEIFSPTDFHSATLVGNRIVLIGSLGYASDRIPGFTQVYVLDLATFALDAKSCTGSSPGWLHRHNASFLPDENAILVTGGLVHTGDQDRQLPENIDDWKLHLADWRWERQTRRQWKRWDLFREDKNMNALFAIRTAAYWKEWVDNNRRAIGDDPKFELQKELDKLKDDLGFEPDLDIVAKLYDPPVPHEKVPDREDEYNVRRIVVNGVTVRYAEDNWSVRITVEGDLPMSTTEALTSDLLRKLSALERKPYELVRL